MFLIRIGICSNIFHFMIQIWFATYSIFFNLEKIHKNKIIYKQKLYSQLLFYHISLIRREQNKTYKKQDNWFLYIFSNCIKSGRFQSPPMDIILFHKWAESYRMQITFPWMLVIFVSSYVILLRARIKILLSHTMI